MASRKRRTSRTLDDVSLDPDGRLRFVLAHAPTDHPNYLETAGHSRGWLTFRWVGERDANPPLPEVTRVPLDALAAELSVRAEGARAEPCGGRFARAGWAPIQGGIACRESKCWKARWRW